jgi:phosphodiesterase/alkaline phosphatase D-like protein
MMVSWVSLQAAPGPVVQWGTGGSFGSSSNANITTYTAAGWVGTIYNALITGLKPLSTYTYRVGSNNGWSKTWSFNTLPSYSDYKCQTTKDASTSDASSEAAAWPSLNIGVIGDMAYDNFSDATVAHLLQQVNNGTLDVIIHAGDISYADGYQPHWDLL